MNPAEVLELREVLSAGAYVGVFDGTHLRFDENTPAVRIGQPGDQLVMGDWNNDGRETPGIFRGGIWILDITGNGIDESDKRISFGWATDRPVAGDWDGNGYDTVGVFRNGAWYFDQNGDGYTPGRDDTPIWFGWPTDTPVPGDWNGDGKDTPGIFRQGTWVLDETGNGYTIEDRIIRFGLPEARPFSGDWNNDRRDTPGVLQNNKFVFDDYGDGWNGFLNRRPEPEITNNLGSGIPVSGNGLSPSLITSPTKAEGKIVVRVRDRNNGPLSVGSVRITGSGVSMSSGLENGQATFRNLSAGTYQVVAVSPKLGESLIETVVLRTDIATEFPMLHLPAVRLLINGHESGITQTTLLDTVRFRYFINGDESKATVVRVEGRVSGLGSWETVVSEDPQRIKSGNTLTFRPRLNGSFEFRLIVVHTTQSYASTVQKLAVNFPAANARAIVNDAKVKDEMDKAWKETKDFAFANRATGIRKEIGFAIYFNTGTGKYEAGPRFPDKHVGDSGQANIDPVVDQDLSARQSSPNGHLRYLVALFHTHTPYTYVPFSSRNKVGISRVVGPSNTANEGEDYTTINTYSVQRGRRIVGLVYDYVGNKLRKGDTDLRVWSRQLDLATFRIRPASLLEDPAMIYDF